MVQINDIKIEKSEYKGKEYLSIRRWYKKDGEERPGKQGINLKPEEFVEFVKKLDDIKAMMLYG